MQWLIGLAAIATVVGVLVQKGHHFDKTEDDPKFVALRTQLGGWFTAQGNQSFPNRVRQANLLFFGWFDALFHGRGALLEQGLWLGLIFSPFMLLLIRLLLLAAGAEMPPTSGMLLLAITLAFELSMAVVAGRAFQARAKTLSVVHLGLLGGLLVVVLGVVLAVALGVVLLGMLGVVLGGVLLGILGGVLLGVLLGVFGGVLGGVLDGNFSVGLAFGLGFATGAILGGVALQLLRFHFPVHPLRSVALSLVTVAILAAIMRDATVSFYHLLLQDGPIVLTYVAFNLFADGISLLETRWVLRRSLNLGLLALLGLVVVDLVLSAAIFLVLPLVLGELPSFWESIFFQGSRPWLGILFWSTFSTSALFYLFVGTVVFLLLPGHGLARLFHRTVGRFNTIETHPFTAIAWGMILLLTAVGALAWAGRFLYQLGVGS